MPTVTPINNWPIPEDTDLVKDGAKAIRDLGNAIDTSSADFAGGLVHIETQNFSSVSAINFDNVFSSDYRNYFFNFVGSQSSGANMTMRLRASGSNDSTSNYNQQTFQASNTSLTGSRVTAQNLFTITFGASANIFSGNFYGPNQPFNTRLQISGQLVDVNIERYDVNGAFSAGTVFDGFSIIAGAGTINATVSIFGYAKD
jgi:hypothetical protein